MTAAFVLICAAAISFYWLYQTPGGCYEKEFAIGSSVCHQIPSHSFIDEGQQFPLCTRCSGLYLGSFVGLIYFFLQGKKGAVPERGYMILLGFLALAWAGDGINSLVNEFMGRSLLYQTTNGIRLTTGFGMGLVMSTSLATLFNMTVWSSVKHSALLNNPWQIILYSAICALVGFALTQNNLIIFQILGAVCILTVITVITLLYSIFWIILFRKENRIHELSGVKVYLTAGFGTTMVQILLLNLLRNIILG